MTYLNYYKIFIVQKNFNISITEFYFTNKKILGI